MSQWLSPDAERIQRSFAPKLTVRKVPVVHLAKLTRRDSLFPHSDCLFNSLPCSGQILEGFSSDSHISTLLPANLGIPYRQSLK